MLNIFMLLPREITNSNFTTAQRVRLCDTSRGFQNEVWRVVFLPLAYAIANATPSKKPRCVSTAGLLFNQI
jgi:hypothetical protein